MAVTIPNTPFPLGAYLGNPDNSSAANQATYDANYTSFSHLMGAAPQYLTTFVDQNQAISQWVGNSQWAAVSAAASTNARSQTPVIALPRGCSSRSRSRRRSARRASSAHDQTSCVDYRSE